MFYTTYMKILLAVAHTVVGLYVLYWIGLIFFWDLSIPESPIWNSIIQGSILVITLTSLIAVWLYALRNTVTLRVKILAFAAVPVYLYMTYITLT